MKKRIAVAVLCACTMSAQSQAAGWIGNVAASTGDWLSSWGRDLPQHEQIIVPKLKPTGATGKDCLNVHQAKADQNIKDRAAMDASIILPPAKGMTEMACLDKYRNFSLSGMVGFPSLGTLLDQLKSQTCKFIDQQVEQATSPINQSVWLPGGARVDTRTVFGSAEKGKDPVSVNAGPNGQYQLPQIFK